MLLINIFNPRIIPKIQNNYSSIFKYDNLLIDNYNRLNNQLIINNYDKIKYITYNQIITNINISFNIFTTKNKIKIFEKTNKIIYNESVIQTYSNMCNNEFDNDTEQYIINNNLLGWYNFLKTENNNEILYEYLREIQLFFNDNFPISSREFNKKMIDDI